MNWKELLIKYTKIIPEEEVKDRENFTMARDKGYPSIVHPLKLVAEFDDITEELIGYSSYKDFGKFYFVGNNYTSPKHTGKGINTKVMRARNRALDKSKPRIALLNAFDRKSEMYIINKLKEGGAKEVLSYEQVDDIMTESQYNQMKVKRMFRYPPFKKS